MPTTANHLVTEEAVLTATPTTTSGAPATLDGPLTVEVQSGQGTFTVNGLEVVMSSEVPGETVYLISGDADLGAGVVTISDTHTSTVANEQATNLGLGNVVIRPKTTPTPVPGLASRRK
jgi:hypothetical protein